MRCGAPGIDPGSHGFFAESFSRWPLACEGCAAADCRPPWLVLSVCESQSDSSAAAEPAGPDRAHGQADRAAAVGERPPGAVPTPEPHHRRHDKHRRQPKH